MNIIRTKVPGVVIFTPDVYEDERGWFKETLNQYQNFLPVQANQSISKKGVVRGLHYQRETAKLVWVVKGSIYDVALDPETGNWHGEILSDKNHKQLFCPANYSHGFQALEDDTIVCYLMDQYYDAKTEGGYNPEFIQWPLVEKIISEKDKDAHQFPLQ